MDAGCYAVCACRFVLDEDPVRAAAFTHDSGAYGVETTFNGMLEFPRGSVAHIGSSMEQPLRCELVAIGSEGRIEVPDMFYESGTIFVKTGDDERVEAVPAPDRFRVQLDEFSDCVSTGKSPEFPAEDGLANTAALVALSAAAKGGAVVDVERTGSMFSRDT